MFTINVFSLTTIFNFIERLLHIWGGSIPNYLLIFLVWAADTKHCLMKFSETGTVGVLDFVTSEKQKLVLLLVFYRRMKTQKALECFVSQFPSIKIRGVRKSVKLIH